MTYFPVLIERDGGAPHAFEIFTMNFKEDLFSNKNSKNFRRIWKSLRKVRSEPESGLKILLLILKVMRYFLIQDLSPLWFTKSPCFPDNYI